MGAASFGANAVEAIFALPAAETEAMLDGLSRIAKDGESSGRPRNRDFCASLWMRR